MEYYTIIHFFFAPVRYGPFRCGEYVFVCFGADRVLHLADRSHCMKGQLVLCIKAAIEWLLVA